MSKKESTLYYFYSIGCVFCNKVEPIVDKLNSQGYDIQKIDISDGQNKLFKHEVEEKYNFRCGTPLLIDSETGNSICGWRGDKMIKKWADGEEISEPPKPKGEAPRLPQDFFDESQIKDFTKQYKKWAKKNSHLHGLQTAEEIIDKFQKNQEAKNKRKISLDGRLQTIESNLQKLMNHLGVK
tara:strand:+ start:439 stop:984 length:546 start_codon:yes stop_codon:yes gene_type:complete